jgi:hypothetical protein
MSSSLPASSLTSPVRSRVRPSTGFGSRLTRSASRRGSGVQDSERADFTRRTKETLGEVNILMDKSGVYFKNTGIKMVGETPPRDRGRNDPYYRYSPFGRAIGINDYSPFVSPVKHVPDTP